MHCLSPRQALPDLLPSHHRPPPGATLGLTPDKETRGVSGLRHAAGSREKHWGRRAHSLPLQVALSVLCPTPAQPPHRASKGSEHLGTRRTFSLTLHIHPGPKIQRWLEEGKVSLSHTAAQGHRGLQLKGLAMEREGHLCLPSLQALSRLQIPPTSFHCTFNNYHFKTFP